VRHSLGESIVCVGYGQQLLPRQKPAKHADRGEMTRETARAQPGLAPLQQILRDQRTLGTVKMLHAAAMQEFGKLGEVGAIGCARVRRKPAFDGQMIEKSIDQLLHPTTSFRLAATIARRTNL
jgi:hypothetical protein